MTEATLIKNEQYNITEIKTIEIEGYKIHTYEIEYLERIKGLYGFVYITTNLTNNRMYIGQKKVKNKSGNWKEYLGSGVVIQRAITKYGIEFFKRDIIDVAFSKKELDNLERYYSYLFNVVESPMWYNLCYGGGSTSGYKYTEEQRNTLSKRTSGKNNPMYGKHHSEEAKRKVSEANKGNDYWLGKHHSEESKRKISEARKGKHWFNNGKKEIMEFECPEGFVPGRLS